MGQTFVERLQAVLEARGWEPNDWARAAGLPSVSHVNNLLKSKAKNPRPAHETVAALAKAGGVSVEWLGSGKGPSGLEGADGPRLERETQPTYSESEVPRLMNLTNWPELVAAAMSLDEARGVPAWAFEYLGYSNGLLLKSLVPASVVEMAKTVTRFVTQTEAEATLAALRANKR